MRARLKTEMGQTNPQVFVLANKNRFVLGRHRENDVVVLDQHASRRHAELILEDGHWVIRDCETTNGTKVNGQRLQAPFTLRDGDQIRIGDVCLRFQVEPVEGWLAEEPTPVPTERHPELDHTVLQPDELTSLFTFIAATLSETSPQTLVQVALETIQKQTRATLVGLLPLNDEDDLVPRLIHPEQGTFNVHLSQRLTRRVKREGRTAWLVHMDKEGDHTDSLASYHDALCVPVRADESPFGALHVYCVNSIFTAREVQFCEVLAVYLGKSLSLLQSRRALAADVQRFRPRKVEPSDAVKLIGKSPAMERLRETIERLCERPHTILIQGESGVGKELVAEALHKLSSRRKGPLVTVNCAAIAASMPEAELFGHAAHSFTGAVDNRPGYFEQAEMGTLFLDELGELPLEIQAKLLRVIEYGRYRPVGAVAEKKANVRVIAATNRDLEKEVANGKFREDLFFRLVGKIRVPPLREHREDIPELVRHFLEQLSMEYRRPLSVTPAALEKLCEYHWPGNIRQLKSVLEHAAAMTGAEILDVGVISLPSVALSAKKDELPLNLEELEAWAIRQALRRHHGVVLHAAKELGIHRDTLTIKMNKYKIERPTPTPG